MARTGSVLLLSGGIESTTLLHVMAPQETVYPLFVDYGQRAAQQERHAALAQCSALGLELKSLDMSAVGEGFRAGQERKLHVPVPHRNLVILSLALSYAEQVRARRVALALNREDTGAYASAGLPFVEHMSDVAGSLGLEPIHTPLIGMDKAAIVREGLARGVDYALSYSCLLGYAAQCGACPQCEKRRAAFAANGREDPAGFKKRDLPG